MPLAWMACLPLLLCLAFTTKLAIIMLDGPENGSALATLLLVLGFAALAAWLFRLAPAARRPVAQPEPAPAPAPAPAPLASGRVERRRHPRMPVDWAVEIAWSQAVRQGTRLHDLSRGGARLVHRAPEPVGRRGLLHVPGLNLPVPFTVVESRPETGLHIRFDLEGMGLDALEQQLAALVERG
ncbi:MAG: PilZ domain-containing protein [Roseococcus sp.]|nr:PilZ domain-containing protein [Roseococcus sp.]